VEDRLARRLHTDRIDVVSVIDTPIPVRYRRWRDASGAAGGRATALRRW